MPTISFSTLRRYMRCPRQSVAIQDRNCNPGLLVHMSLPTLLRMEDDADVSAILDTVIADNGLTAEATREDRESAQRYLSYFLGKRGEKLSGKTLPGMTFEVPVENDLALSVPVDLIVETDTTIELVDIRTSGAFMSTDDFALDPWVLLAYFVGKNNWPDKQMFLTIWNIRTKQHFSGVPKENALQVTAQIFSEAAFRYHEAQLQREHGGDVEDLFPAKCHDHCPSCPVRSSCQAYSNLILSPETIAYDPENLGATAEAYAHFRAMETMAKTLKDEAKLRIVTLLESTEEVEGEKTSYVVNTDNGYKVSLTMTSERRMDPSFIVQCLLDSPDLREKLLPLLSVSFTKLDAFLKDATVPESVRTGLKKEVVQAVGSSKIDVRAIR